MQPIRRWSKTALISAVSLFLLTGCGKNIPVLDPQGPVGRKELFLIEWPFVLMLIVILIVFAIFAWISIKYRARPDNEDYEPPDQEGNTWLEIVWTAIPVVIVVAIAIPTVIVTFRLQKPPTVADKSPIVIRVASAHWKWLFSYPQQGIETVNYVDIPAGVPVKFELTAIGAMNSFWVPSLGGMDMDMPGKTLGLWLQADHPGTYQGRSANFSGKGFTHMTFDVVAKPEADFKKWAAQVKQTAKPLSQTQYLKLLKPSTVGKMTFSNSINPDKYNGSMEMSGTPNTGGDVPGTKSAGGSKSDNSAAGMNMSGGSMAGMNMSNGSTGS